MHGLTSVDSTSLSPLSAKVCPGQVQTQRVDYVPLDPANRGSETPYTRRNNFATSTQIVEGPYSRHVLKNVKDGF